MVGETLEQHCETEFNRIRATAFPQAYFEKDNDASSGSKGDYLFRDLDNDDNEIVSIMFEMKNENDETATKKKNEDFLKNSIEIGLRRVVNTPFLFLCSNPKVSYTTQVSLMFFIDTRKCTLSVRNFLFQS